MSNWVGFFSSKTCLKTKRSTSSFQRRRCRRRQNRFFLGIGWTSWSFHSYRSFTTDSLLDVAVVVVVVVAVVVVDAKDVFGLKAKNELSTRWIFCQIVFRKNGKVRAPRSLFLFLSLSLSACAFECLSNTHQHTHTNENTPLCRSSLSCELFLASPGWKKK